MGALGSLDLSLYRLLNRDFGPAVDAAARLLSSRGVGLLALVVVVVGILVRWGRKGLWFALPMLVSLGLTDLIGARVLKPLFARPRPIEILPGGTFRQLVDVAHGGSMPSLHASNAFSVAVFLWLVRPSLGAPALVLATLIALSRVVGGVHWPTDIVAGAMLGALVSTAVWLTIPAWRAGDRTRIGPARLGD
ncbi:MAG TPA: phosphatase PAP2 family protein [Myxococcaceae bacterium]|nr:phosphatase PAP2 family protein [Myxococcaceae bacterium]